MRKRARSTSPSEASHERVQRRRISHRPVSGRIREPGHRPQARASNPARDALTREHFTASTTISYKRLSLVLENSKSDETTNTNLQGPLIPAKVQHKLNEAAKRTPRFLFRAWCDGADQRSCDSINTIIPTAYQKYGSQADMFQLPKHALAQSARQHLRGKQEPSLFSDWTHSLHAALDKALELRAVAALGTFNTHTCVLDRIKSPDTIILHTSALGLIDKRIPKVPVSKHKFLAFGIVSGPGYKAIPFGWLRWMRGGWLTAPMSSLGNPATELRLARSLGVQFGGAFRLPVIAMLHSQPILTMAT
jgi:hypothetical protein